MYIKHVIANNKYSEKSVIIFRIDEIAYRLVCQSIISVLLFPVDLRFHVENTRVSFFLSYGLRHTFPCNFAICYATEEGLINVNVAILCAIFPDEMCHRLRPQVEL